MYLAPRSGKVRLLFATLWLCASIVHGGASPLILDVVAEKGGIHRRLSRREGPITVDLDDEAVNFYANLSVGTPPQSLRFLVDTNSADLVAQASSNPACRDHTCSDAGTYTANSSGSYEYQWSNFSIEFSSGLVSTGDYATETVSFANTTIQAMEFAVGYAGNLTCKKRPPFNTTLSFLSATNPSAVNVLGIGYIGLEQTEGWYANLPVRLFNKGVTNIVGYSLWFKGSALSTAQLIFGGVDTNRFFGTLETIPITMDRLKYQLVTVQMEGLSLKSGDNKTTNITDSPIPVVLDSGTSSFVLMSQRVSQIAAQVGAVNYTSSGYNLLIKKFAEMDNRTSFNVQFGATTISVPMADMVLPFNETWGYLSVIASDTLGVEVIGLPFFKNAYTVFDYSHNQVSLAALVPGSTTANVTAISNNGVVGLTGV